MLIEIHTFLGTTTVGYYNLDIHKDDFINKFGDKFTYSEMIKFLNGEASAEDPKATLVYTHSDFRVQLDKIEE